MMLPSPFSQGEDHVLDSVDCLEVLSGENIICKQAIALLVDHGSDIATLCTSCATAQSVGPK